MTVRFMNPKEIALVRDAINSDPEPAGFSPRIFS